MTCCPRWRSCPLRTGPMDAWLPQSRPMERMFRSRTRPRSGATRAFWVDCCRGPTSLWIGCPRREVEIPTLNSQTTASLEWATNKFLKVSSTSNEVRNASRAVRNGGRQIGFVPTMGALHEGHLSLVRAARGASDVVSASIFVNPTQFGPNEDLAKYPRSFERDCKLLESEGGDLVFAPTVEEMYPTSRDGSVRPAAATWVTVEGLSNKLDGRSRPGHFRGVTTVVSKLFHIVEPDAAFFGQKDAAQVAVVRRMVQDLNLPVEIVICPIVREPDGLAMSSRNAYLDPKQRQQALVLHRALARVQQM